MTRRLVRFLGSRRVEFLESTDAKEIRSFIREVEAAGLVVVYQLAVGMVNVVRAEDPRVESR